MQITTTQTALSGEDLIQDLVRQEQVRLQLGQNDFMELLVAQLQNQDPLEPLNDQEFIGQLTQFNILDQMTAFNASLGAMQALQGTALLGTHVQGQTSLGEFVEGVVVEVILLDNQATLVLDNGTQLPLANVTRVLPGDDPAAGSASV